MTIVTDDSWKAAGAPLWLAEEGRGCSFYGQAEHPVSVNAAGHLSGEFVVPGSGGCRMSEDTGERTVAPGRYTVAFQCTA